MILLLHKTKEDSSLTSQGLQSNLSVQMTHLLKEGFSERLEGEKEVYWVLGALMF